jgi:hypothetical protein
MSSSKLKYKNNKKRAMHLQVVDKFYLQKHEVVEIVLTELDL